MYDEYKELGPATGKREQLREIGGLKLNRKTSASVLTLYRDFYTNQKKLAGSKHKMAWQGKTLIKCFGNIQIFADLYYNVKSYIF